MHSLTHAPLFKRVILAACCITLIIGSISIGLVFLVSYMLQIKEVKNQLNQLNESQKDMLTQSIWDFDDNAIRLQLQGILSHPDIIYVELEVNGAMHRVGEQESVSKEGLHYSYRLLFSHSAAEPDQYLGNLHVHGTLENVKNRMIYGYLTILAGMSGALLLTCILIYSLFQHQFYRHWQRIVAFAETLDLNSLETRLVLQRKTSPHKVKDELELFVNTLNDLRRRLREGLLEKKLLQEDRKILEKVVEQAGDAMLITDMNWQIRYVNRALLKRMDCSRESSLTRDLAEFLMLSPGVLPYGAIRETIVSGRTWSNHLVRRNNSVNEEEDITLTAIQAGENDTSLFFVAVIKNVTREWALERQLLQAKKMESIGTLAGGIAHDFNNLLSVILGYAEMAQIKYADHADILRDLGPIQKAGNRAKNLVKQILTFSREAEVQFLPLRLQSIVAEVHSMLTASLPATIVITIEMDDKDPPVFADAGQMHQVLMNLCTNAKHAMHNDKGNIAVSLEPVNIDPLNQREISSMPTGRYMKLSITDDGCGMDETTKSRIFDPFFTTKKTGEGTGLGLSVVHGIIKKHRGEIVVKSAPGEGTTFSIFLPMADEAFEQMPRLVQATYLGMERVMVLDDEEMVGEMVEDSLTRLGYEVSRHTSPQAALDRFSENPDNYDIVITDMTMPIMTGDIFSRKILAIRPDIPIIICTGYSETIDERRAKQIGIRRFLMKPIIATELASTIRQVFDEK